MLNKHKSAQLLLWPWNLFISATATAYALPVASRSQGNSTALLEFPWFHHEKHRRNYEILTLEVVKNTRFVWQVLVVVVVEVQFSHLCHLGWITLSLAKVYAVTLFLKFQKCQWLLVEVPTHYRPVVGYQWKLRDKCISFSVNSTVPHQG